MDEVRSKKIRKDVNEDLIFMLMRRGKGDKFSRRNFG